MDAAAANCRAASLPLRCFVWLLALLAPPPILAQDTPDLEEDDVRPQVWIDYNPSAFASDRVQLFGDVGLRFFMDDSDWWRFVVRPGARYCLDSRICFTAGVGSFYTSSDLDANQWEIRPFQGISAMWPRLRVRFEHYVRLEQSFDFDTETWSSASSARLRYLLRPTFRWGTRYGGSYWRLSASVEEFLSLGGEQGLFREQFRFALGLERSFRIGLRVLLEVTWQSRESALHAGDSVNDIFIRVRVFHGRSGETPE